MTDFLENINIEVTENNNKSPKIKNKQQRVKNGKFNRIFSEKMGFTPRCCLDFTPKNKNLK